MDDIVVVLSVFVVLTFLRRLNIDTTSTSRNLELLIKNDLRCLLR